MPDEELLRFAKNESQKLTIESFHLLKAEFESRNLDLNVLNTVEVEKQLAEASKLSEFEKTTANEFLSTIWNFAFDEKEKGKKDREIFNALLKKKVNPEYAHMLIESLEPKAKELADSLGTEIIVGWILLIVGGALMIFTLSGESSLNFLLWGSMLILGGVLRLSKSYSRKKKFETIISNIEVERSEQNNLYQ